MHGLTPSAPLKVLQMTVWQKRKAALALLALLGTAAGTAVILLREARLPRTEEYYINRRWFYSSLDRATYSNAITIIFRQQPDLLQGWPSSLTNIPPLYAMVTSGSTRLFRDMLAHDEGGILAIHGLCQDAEPRDVSLVMTWAGPAIVNAHGVNRNSVAFKRIARELEKVTGIPCPDRNDCIAHLEWERLSRLWLVDRGYKPPPSVRPVLEAAGFLQADR